MSSFVRSFIKPKKPKIDNIQSVEYCNFVRIPEGPHKKLLIIPYDSSWGQRLYEATGIPIKKASLSLVLNRNAETDEYIIVKTDEMSIEFSQHADLLKQRGYHFITCDTQNVVELGDKIRFSNHYLKEYMPKSYPLHDPKFPCLLKKNEGMAGRNVRVINNYSDFKAAINSIPDIENYIIQEAIESNKEYSVQFLVIEGRIITYIAYYQISTEILFVRPRSTVIETTECRLDSPILSVFEMFFIHYSGFINANFKLINNRPIIFEFNTRISGDIFYISDSSVSDLLTEYCKNC